MTFRHSWCHLVLLIVLALCAHACAQKQVFPSVLNYKNGKLEYIPDEKGNRIPDFSHAGYMGGGVAIPNVPARVFVTPKEGEDAQRIQAAIDYVSTLKPDDNGIRGAVLLTAGTFKIDQTIRINESGVVLRGSGPETILLASSRRRNPLISIATPKLVLTGPNGPAPDLKPYRIIDDYVPVGATTFKVEGTFSAGEGVIIRRPSTDEWIKLIQMDYMGGDRHSYKWKPGSRDVAFDRTIVSVSGNQITLDAPITTALEKDYGGATIERASQDLRRAQVGVESLRCDSIFDQNNAKDEDHSWYAIHFENAKDAWVRQVTASHFASSCVYVAETCKRITVEDCKSLSPVSETANERRRAFYSLGQQVLFQQCYSEDAMHDFAVGFGANLTAFVQCESKNSLSFSGPIDSWASGILYDNVRIDGNALCLMNREYEINGAGWCAANCLAFQSAAALVRCENPPGAKNWVIGCMGSFTGRGHFQNNRDGVDPDSVYITQLQERLGKEAAATVDFLVRDGSESSNPPESEVPRLVANSQKPLIQLPEWIDQAGQRRPIPTKPGDATSIDQIKYVINPPPAGHHDIEIVNGWVTIDGKIITGGVSGITWWNGGTRPADLVELRSSRSPTRFVPGRVGGGLTDDLGDLVEQMASHGTLALEHHYGLWYDVRDIDHERIRRMDGNVVPPFYELPFARSGKELAWDGLSKYDLTKYNAWYWDRLRDLTRKFNERGLVLLQHHYFQHNILEAGAHWASNPWRSANNINNTGFPEPPPYAGDKRIFTADQYYDVNNPVRRALHEAFIRKSVENYPDRANVIHLTSDEYTGPFEFTQFWIDTIGAWEKQTGRNAIVGLLCCKDVQDKILADPERLKSVDVIVLKFNEGGGWWYQPDGTLFAQPGGNNLSPRQYARLKKPKNAGTAEVVRMVREYKNKYPGKAVYAWGDGADGWALLAAGSSMPKLRSLDPKLAADIVSMSPIKSSDGSVAIGNPQKGFLAYSTAGEVKIDAADGEFTATVIDPRSGNMRDVGKVNVSAGVNGPGGGPWVLWLHKE